MNLIRKMWNHLSRICLLLIGILLLIISLPHKTPWDMSLVNVNSDKGQEVIINFPIIQFSIHTSAKTVFIAAGVALFALMLIMPSGRQAAINCLKKIKPIPFVLLPMALLIFTMKPVTLPGKNGMPVILCLTIGAVGLLYSFAGIYPFVVRLGKYRIGGIAQRIAKRAAFLFFNVDVRLFLGIIFALAFIASNLSCYFIFEHTPHVGDSIDQVFHGKIFALGKVTVPSHKYREFFSYGNMINNGRWYSQYPPAHSFLMMFGVMLGVTWLVNPIIGSLSIVTFYFIGKEIYDEKTGRLAAFLGLFSPFIIFMASGFMSHVSVMFFMCLFVLFFARTINRGRFYHPLIAGASLGMALNGRPMTALALCSPFALYAFVLLIRHFRKYAFRFSIMLITILAFAGILLTFNYLTNGDPLLFGYIEKYGEGHYPGFGHSPWGTAHSPAKGLQQNLNNLNALNKYLFEWPIPCLFFAFLLFASMTKNKWDYLLMGSFWALSLAYFFYFFQSWYMGPRYMYESSFAAILLTSRGILKTPALVNGTFGLKARPERVRAAVGSAVLICIMVALIFNIRPLTKVYSNKYWSIDTLVFKAVEKNNIKNAVVFTQSLYNAVFVRNEPLFDGEIIYVRDLGVKNRFMMECYSDRRYYLANGSKISEIFPPSEDEILVEAESLRVVESSADRVSPQDMSDFGPNWAGNSQLHVASDAPDDYVALSVPVEKAGVYEISIYFTHSRDYGQVQLMVNGEPVGKVFDGYGNKVTHGSGVNMGKANLNAGENRFGFRVVGKNKAAKGYQFGMDCLVLKRSSE